MKPLLLSHTHCDQVTPLTKSKTQSGFYICMTNISKVMSDLQVIPEAIINLPSAMMGFSSLGM